MAAPTFREADWLSIVLAIDPEHYSPDKDIYLFSNGSGFENTDASDSGIYDGS